MLLLATAGLVGVSRVISEPLFLTNEKKNNTSEGERGVGEKQEKKKGAAGC